MQKKPVEAFIFLFSKEFSKSLKTAVLLKKNKKIKNPQAVEAQGFSMELLPRFELGTSSLPRMRSTD